MEEKAIKFDKEKPRIDLIPLDKLILLLETFMENKENNLTTITKENGIYDTENILVNILPKIVYKLDQEHFVINTLQNIVNDLLVTITSHNDSKNIELKFSTIMISVAQVLTYGANKYGDHNWKNDMEYHRLYNALWRHIYYFCSGEELDSESHMHHIWHIITNCMFILWYLDKIDFGELNNE